MTIIEIRKQLEKIRNESEAMKIIAELLAPKEAYCDLYKISLRKQIHAEEMGMIASEYIKQGTQYTESRLEREGRCTKRYKEEQDKFGKALIVKIFLKTYLAGVKMSHEMEIAKIYRVSSEIKKGIYSEGQ